MAKESNYHMLMCPTIFRNNDNHHNNDYAITVIANKVMLRGEAANQLTKVPFFRGIKHQWNKQ